MMFLRGLGDCTAAQFGPQTCIPDDPVTGAATAPGFNPSTFDATDPASFSSDCPEPSADPQSHCYNETYAHLRAIDERAGGQSIIDDAVNLFTNAATGGKPSTKANQAWYTRPAGLALAAALTIGSVVAYRHYKGKRITP